MTRKKNILLIQYVLCFLVVIGTVFIWYENNHWSVLMGDDLIAVYGFDHLGLKGNLLNDVDLALGKVRPVQKTILWLVYKLCGIDYKKYYTVTRWVLVLTTVLICYIARKTDISKFKTIVIAILIVTCPFSAYGAWQYIGVTESFSLFICLACGYFTYKTIYENQLKKILNNIWLNTFCFALLIFNAERFMYLVAIPILVVWFKRELSRKNKFWGTVILVSPIILRSLILRLLGSVALGTGRQGIGELISTLIPYAIRGFINMFGFSIGDSWHGGFTLLQISSWILVLSFLRVFVFSGVFSITIYKLVVEKNEKYIEIVIWYLYSLTSLFCYALVASTHGEDRFLWVPYSFYLFAIARYMEISCTDGHKFFNKNMLRVLVVVISILVVCSNWYYKVNKVQVHYRYSQEMAETAIKNARQLEHVETVKNVACVKRSDYQWIFYGTSFWNYYLKEGVNVVYYDTAEQLAYDRELLGTQTIVIYPAKEFVVPYKTSACWINDFFEENK